MSSGSDTLIGFELWYDQEIIFFHLDSRTIENCKRLRAYFGDFQHRHREISIEVKPILHTVFK